MNYTQNIHRDIYNMNASITDDKQELLLKKLKDALSSISNEKPVYIKTKLETSEKSTEFENINVRSIKLIEKF